MPAEITLDTPKVHAARRGDFRHIEHIREFTKYVSSQNEDERALANRYVMDMVPEHYAPGGWLGIDPSTSAGNVFVPDEGTFLRFASKKKVGGANPTHVVSYVETARGLSIWEAGVSVVVNRHDQQSVRATSSQSSLHIQPVIEDIDPTGAPFEPADMTLLKLVACLGLNGFFQPKRVASFVPVGMLYYRFRQAERLGWTPNPDDPPGARLMVGNRQETLPLPGLPASGPGKFEEEKHYIVTEVLFTTEVRSGNKIRKVNWRALIHVGSGHVLFLRAAEAACFGDLFPISAVGESAIDTGYTGAAIPAGTSSASGYVLCDDPLTYNGTDLFDPLGSVSDAKLSVLRVDVDFDIIVRGASNPVDLRGQWGYITDLWNPGTSGNPEDDDSIAPYEFCFQVITEAEKFTAVNAYYHFDSMFRMVDQLGLLDDFFPLDMRVPIQIDPHGMEELVDAKTMGYQDHKRLESVYYGRTKPGQWWGNGLDVRVTLHEFGHALLWSSLNSPNFAFAHSAGDSLAAIVCDPDTKHIQFTSPRGDVKDSKRYETFPWLMHENPATTGRWHGGNNRTVSTYAWGGQIDMDDTAVKKTFWGYEQEQILSTTLFRAYQALGGDAYQVAHEEMPDSRQTRQLAARLMAYLIIRGIGGLPEVKEVPTGLPDAYATALMEADTGTVAFADAALPATTSGARGSVPGGTANKVIRWSFEQQGLYQRATPTTPVVEAGQPKVDIYIDDSRNGGYLPYLETFRDTKDIWNRNSAYVALPDRDADLSGEHEEPTIGADNFLYVRLKNRGYEAFARKIVVRAYHSGSTGGLEWPTDWVELPGSPLAGPDIGTGATEFAGPFVWRPSGAGTTSVLVSVSADGDPSNVDPTVSYPCAAGPTPIWRLVPFDNNMAVRKMIAH
jgi:hypothetical protein